MDKIKGSEQGRLYSSIQHDGTLGKLRNPSTAQYLYVFLKLKEPASKIIIFTSALMSLFVSGFWSCFDV